MRVRCRLLCCSKQCIHRTGEALCCHQETVLQPIICLVASHPAHQALKVLSQETKVLFVLFRAWVAHQLVRYKDDFCLIPSDLVHLVVGAFLLGAHLAGVQVLLQQASRVPAARAHWRYVVVDWLLHHILLTLFETELLCLPCKKEQKDGQKQDDYETNYRPNHCCIHWCLWGQGCWSHVEGEPLTAWSFFFVALIVNLICFAVYGDLIVFPSCGVSNCLRGREGGPG